MANADDIMSTLEPGSTDYGDRQVLTNQLQEALASSQQQGPMVPAGTPPPPEPGGSELDYLDAEHSSDLPVTDGLSVGPGASPPSVNPTDSPKIEKLRLIATGARSPVLRHMARNALKAEIRRGAGR